MSRLENTAMVEAYWQALTRDIPFSQYGYEPGTDAAIQDLNRLSAFLGPLQSGRVTPATLFRGTSSGDLNGPYLSQFLWKDIPYGAGVIVQQYSTPHSGIDFLTSYDEWLAIQNGQSPPRSMILDDSPRFIRNARDLTWYVHQDFTYQAYLNACQILLHSGNVGLSRSNPYSSFNKESAFVTFGAANILEWIGSIASAALRAAWCQKWLIHRRLRPEEFGGRVYQRIANSKSYPIQQLQC